MTHKELLEAFDKLHNYTCVPWSRRWEPDLACNCGLLQAVDEMTLEHLAHVDAVSEERYDAGYESGYDEGLRETHEDLDDIRNAAYEQGYNEAHAEGFNKGYSKARDEFEVFDDAS